MTLQDFQAFYQLATSVQKEVDQLVASIQSLQQENAELKQKLETPLNTPKPTEKK